MVGNAAGPVMSIFLISQGMQKEQFMGTWAWFFLIVNLTKVPLLLSLELFAVNMVTPNMLWFDLCVLPLVVLARLSAGECSTSSPSGFSTRFVLVLAGVAALRMVEDNVRRRADSIERFTRHCKKLLDFRETNCPAVARADAALGETGRTRGSPRR